MSDFRKLSTALALGLALIATPSLAKEAKHHHAIHPGYAARAQAIGGEDGGLITSGPRAQALHQCNGKVDKFKDYTWGMEQDQDYRACMAQHGQPE